MAASTERGVGPRHVAQLVALAAVWGASFLFIKVAVHDVGPLTVAASRLALGVVGIGGWIRLSRGRGGLRRALAGVRAGDALLLAGTASAVPFVLIAWAETRITASLAGILNASVPLLTALFAVWLAPATRLRGWRTIGLFVGFAGVALVVGTDVGGNGLGIVAMCGAVTLYATGAHVAKLRFGEVDPLGVAFAQTAVAGLFVVPLALILDRPAHIPPVDTLGALAALGFGGTAFGFVLYYRLLATIGPQHAVAVTYLAPIFAITYGVVLLHEHLSVASVLGIAVIITGEVLTVVPPRNRAEAVGVMEEAAA